MRTRCVQRERCACFNRQTKAGENRSRRRETQAQARGQAQRMYMSRKRRNSSFIAQHNTTQHNTAQPHARPTYLRTAAAFHRYASATGPRPSHHAPRQQRTGTALVWGSHEPTQPRRPLQRQRQSVTHHSGRETRSWTRRTSRGPTVWCGWEHRPCRQTCLRPRRAGWP